MRQELVMHEFSLMSNLLGKIDKIVKDNSATKATKVVVTIGAMAHISPDHFKEHFIHGTSGTVAEDAELDVTLNTDQNDPHAAEILLKSVDVQ
jgi:hydrogenase nickel incorporation protein HypA/HybF